MSFTPGIGNWSRYMFGKLMELHEESMKNNREACYLGDCLRYFSIYGVFSFAKLDTTMSSVSLRFWMDWRQLLTYGWVTRTDSNSISLIHLQIWTRLAMDRRFLTRIHAEDCSLSVQLFFYYKDWKRKLQGSLFVFLVERQARSRRNKLTMHAEIETGRGNKIKTSILKPGVSLFTMTLLILWPIH